jgi:hypothetical protein
MISRYQKSFELEFENNIDSPFNNFFIINCRSFSGCVLVLMESIHHSHYRGNSAGYGKRSNKSDIFYDSLS